MNKEIDWNSLTPLEILELSIKLRTMGYLLAQKARVKAELEEKETLSGAGKTKDRCKEDV